MRRFGPLIVFAILFILAGVGATYYARLKSQARNAPVAPKPLPPGTESALQDWTWTQTSGNQQVVTVRAKDFKEVGDKFLLEGVELHIAKKDSKEYNLVKSAKAEVDQKTSVLYSDGDVEITMGVPESGEISGRLLAIKSSGVHLEIKTGKAYTDRPATFSFDRGDGKAVGADYDPGTHELHMHSQAELVWRGTDRKAKPMTVDADSIVYKEAESKVYLSPAAKLSRDALTLNTGPAVVTLKDGAIDVVNAQNAQGVDQEPNRKLDYAADELMMQFDAAGQQIQKITGVNHARLVATSAAGETTVTTDHIDLDFDTSAKESTLEKAVASGHSEVQSKPAVKGNDSPDRRILKSDVIETKMRAGGQEIETVDTTGPGTLEFVPTRPDAPHRWLNGDRISIAYGSDNQIETFKATNASTRTEKPKRPDAAQPPAPSLTWSKNLLARFQPGSSKLDRLEQWGDFRYEEGDRKARADRAVLNQAKNQIDLNGGARTLDSTGSISADHITMDQASGDFTAQGGVNSTRMPDKKKKDQAPGMLSQDEPLQGKARKMSSSDNNLKVHYEGSVLLWQGANRLQADVVDIDRDAGVLKAHGHVVSQLMDKQQQAADGKDKKAAGPPVFTIVHAPDLTYTDENRVAYYTGGVELDRGATRVKSRELKAFLRDNDNDNDNDSSLDHAFADGNVEIVQTAADRTRTGNSEHAEYYIDQDKVVLRGGEPRFTDSKQGATEGQELIWYAKDDRLLVNGAKGKPAQSNLRRKKSL